MFAISMNRAHPILNQLLATTAASRHLPPARVRSAFFLPTQQTVAPFRHYTPVPVVEDPRINVVYTRLIQRQDELEVIRQSYQNALRVISENPHPNPHEGPTGAYKEATHRIQEIDKELKRLGRDLEFMEHRLY